MSVLSREVQFTQNPALGATLQWRFACGYNEGHPSRNFAPVPLLFLVLPCVLHKQTAEFIASTRRTSGLRAFAAKFGESSTSKQDVLIGLHSRVDQWRQLSWESVCLAVETRLIQLNLNGTVIPLSHTQPRASVPRSISPLLSESEKLGFWCGQLSLHEVANALRIRF